MAKSNWTKMKRDNLQALAKEGWTKEKMKDMLCLSNWNITNELARGLTEKEFSERRYVNYSPFKAMVAEVKEMLDEESFQLLVDGIKKGYLNDNEDKNGGQNG